jgi:hypothetical protein
VRIVTGNPFVTTGRQRIFIVQGRIQNLYKELAIRQVSFIFFNHRPLILLVCDFNNLVRSILGHLPPPYITEKTPAYRIY